MAVEDGDHIYGVVKNTAINHGGKSNGYSVPNPVAQASVIQQAYDTCDVNPRTVSYIEAHGTGTALGDPIEVTGLTSSFEEYTKDKQFCSIGSVKSNIGHCESAAGIAALTKVLLQMKHKKLIPSLHSKVLNPNIDFESTPFYVQQTAEEWKRPVIEMDGVTKEYPRIAGLSAFGAGGANAHVIIEEYISEETNNFKKSVVDNIPNIVVLTARNEEQLSEVVNRMLSAIEDKQVTNENILNVSYTLQVGREAMEERLGLIVTDVVDLKEKLERFLQGHKGIQDLYRGQVKRNKETLAAFTADEELREALDKWINRKKYNKLLNFWVKGLVFNWDDLYTEGKPQRVSLPTYPFAKDIYWLPELVKKTLATNVDSIHPMLQRNVSDLSGLKFSTKFTGNESFLTDHVINNNSILPAVAYIEMIRAAVHQVSQTPADGSVPLSLSNLIWASPYITGNGEGELQIHFNHMDEEQIGYEVYSASEHSDTNTVHCQGYATLGVDDGIETALDINSLIDECSLNSLTSDECYAIFDKIGFNYGDSHRGIQDMYIGSNQVLVKLWLPEEVINKYRGVLLHPGMLDSVLQSTIGLLSGTTKKPLVPFALDQIEINDKCTSSMWAFLKLSDAYTSDDSVQKVDIVLQNDTGSISARMTGLTCRALNNKNQGNKSTTKDQFISASDLTNTLIEADLITGNPENYSSLISEVQEEYQDKQNS
jgi:polyketide synthase PksN